jgi:hypothetical protein
VGLTGVVVCGVWDAGVAAVSGVAGEGDAVTGDGVGGVFLTSALKATPLAVSCWDSSEPTVPVEPMTRIAGVIIEIL